MSEQTLTRFEDIDELGLRLDLPDNERGKIPKHEPFTDDDGNIREAKCEHCEARYGIYFSRIYRTKRSFTDLNNQVQTRLAEQHRDEKTHPPIILLKWSDTTRKDTRK